MSNFNKKMGYFCGRKDKFNIKTARICSMHFTDEDFENNLQFQMGLCDYRRLKPNAIPSRIDENNNGSVSKRSQRAKAKISKEIVVELLKKPDEFEFSLPDNTETSDVSDQLSQPVCIQTDNTNLNILKEEIEQLRNENEILKKSAIKFKLEILSLKEELSKSNYEKNNLEDKLYKIFSKGQVKKLKNNSKKLNWNEADIAQSITLYSASQKGYKLLKRKGFPLPAIRTLQRWSQKINISTGIIKPVLKIMKAATQLDDAQKVCVLTFDEMKVKEVYCYDKSSDTTLKPVKYVQVAMLRGVMSKWKQPIFYSFDCKMTKEILFKILDAIKECGYPVVSITCDMGGGNRGLYKELNVDMNKPWFMYENNKIYTFADVPHLIKLLRNHFIDQGFVINEKVVKKEIILKLLSCTSSSELSILHKITSNNLTVSGAERQKVKLATKLFSHTVAKALSRAVSLGILKDDNWEECYNLFKTTNDWFDVMNVRMYAADSRERVHAYGLKIDVQNQILDNMTEMMLNMRVNGRNVMLPFQQGIVQSNNAIKLLFQDLKERFNFKYLLTYRLNQDVLENFFGVIRSKGGLNDHPDRQEFKFRLRSYILGFNEGAISENGNVNCDDTPDLEGLKSPLTATILKKIAIEPSRKKNECNEKEQFESLEFDGLENLAGYICHKLKEIVPNILSNEHSYTWVNHLSEGGLSKPTSEIMFHLNELENIFNVVNGSVLDIRENYLQHLKMLAEKVDCDEKVKTLFFRSRMFFRMRKLNRELINQWKLKSRKRKLIKTVT